VESSSRFSPVLDLWLSSNRGNFSTRVEQTFLPLNDNRYERGLRLFQPLHGRRVIIDPVMPPEQDGVLEDVDGHLPNFSVRVRTQLIPE
jgi:hypothetical protein